MSKQSDAKAEQNYRREQDKCESCQHFKKDVVTVTRWGSEWSQDKNLRCGIGGFKVHKTAICDRFERKESA